MYTEERRLQILEIIRKEKRVDVNPLAEQLEISRETIRRDLRNLEMHGFIKRTHGGAIINDEPARDEELPVMFRKAINIEKKCMIDKKASSFVKDDDVIVLDNSTTVTCMIKYLPRHYKLTIITNALQTMFEISGVTDSDWSCFFLGGALRRKSNATTGFIARNAFSFFRPNKLFMSCAGIDNRGIMTEGNINEVEVKQDFIQYSEQKYLLLDDTKFNTTGIVNEGSVSNIDYLITNSSVDRRKLEFLRDKDVKILFDIDI
jgi:DeoR/GlpR family transcriptional regulator of sugar metabolism